MGALQRVAILSVSAGTGHMRVAEALAAAVKEENPGAQVFVLDTFRYASPFLEKLVLGTYMEMLKFTPAVYGYLYRGAEGRRPLAGLVKQEFNRILNRVAAPRLAEFLQDVRPQVIACTHPFPVGILDQLKKRGLLHVPVVAAVTDFTVHPFWIFPRVEAYLVAGEDLKEPFRQFGYPVERVHATGIPIDPAFARPVDVRRLQRELGLDPALPAVLVTGGGLGMGPLAEVVRRLMEGPASCQLLVLTGQNEQLRHRLSRLAAGAACPVKVLGFARNVHELMSVAQLMVGKAGGISCAEALSKGLPVVIVSPLPGQEERNAAYLCRAGAAVLVGRVEMVGQEVAALLGDKERYRRMAQASAGLGRPRAAREAVALMRLLVEESSVRWEGRAGG